MSGRPGLWESPARAGGPAWQFKSEEENRSSLWDYPVVSPTSGAAAYGPGSSADGSHHTLDQSSRSGIVSFSHENGDIKGKGKASTISHVLNTDDMSASAFTAAPFHSPRQHPNQVPIWRYDAASAQSLNRGDTPALPVPGSISSMGSMGSMGSFAPGHHSPDRQPSAPFGGQPPRSLPSFFGPQDSGHDGPRCRCAVCSSGSQAMCFQQQLAQQQASISAVWDDERTRLEACRSRVEALVRQEGRIILDHYRQGWHQERDRLQSEIEALRKAVKGLEDGHLQICDDHRKLWVENLQLQEENLRLMEDNSRLREANSKPRDGPTPWSTSFGGQLRSSWPVQAPTRVTSRSPPPPMGIPAYRDPPLIESPSERRAPTMSPQPVYDTSISPVLAPCADSPVPVPYCPVPPAPFRLDSPDPLCPASPVPTRSPKRPLSVIDVNEVDAGLDSIALRANAVRRATFAEGISEEAPPFKRQRSLSQEYCIVNNLSGDDGEAYDDKDDEEGDGERDKEEIRRLKMHAGHTPPRSPPVRHSQGSPTPIAPCSPPERGPVMLGDMALSESLRSVSEDSGDVEKPVDVEDSGDVALEGPLMIQNKPAEDEGFLAALNKKLQPISQGVDALPRAVQPPSPMPESLSAVRGERVGVRCLDSNRATRSESSSFSKTLSTEDKESDKRTEDVKADDDDDDDFGGNAKVAEPDVPLKFKSTSNFGAPFGRM